jgi:serine/threonine-protein kinase
VAVGRREGGGKRPERIDHRDGTVPLAGPRTWDVALLFAVSKVPAIGPVHLFVATSALYLRPVGNDGRTERAASPLVEIGELVAETWEIRSLIGAGGMGQVWEAFDRFLQRIVAIKIAPGGEAPGLRAEAQALAAIRHPGLVTVHAGGVHRNFEYVVMERIFGVDLAEHIARRRRASRPPTLVEALEVLAPLADALAAVHRAGIAHRDVKPENVILAPGGRVVLADFGVFLPEFEFARSSVRSGSPAYMAPETIRGDVGAGGGYLVDVYAFGVLSYELFAGSLPFSGASSADYYLAHLGVKPQPLRALRPDVPTGLDAMIGSCLEKDPHDRPPSMDDVAFQLRGLLVAERGASSDRGQPSARWAAAERAPSSSRPGPTSRIEKAASPSPEILGPRGTRGSGR